MGNTDGNIIKKFFDKKKRCIQKTVLSLILVSIGLLCACQSASSTNIPLWKEEYEKGIELIDNKKYEEAIDVLKEALQFSKREDVIDEMALFRIYEATGDAYYGLSSASSFTSDAENAIWYYSMAAERNAPKITLFGVLEKMVQVFVTRMYYYESETIGQMQDLKGKLLQIEDESVLIRRNKLIDDLEHILTWYQIKKSNQQGENDRYIMYSWEIPPKSDEESTDFGTDASTEESQKETAPEDLFVSDWKEGEKTQLETHLGT